jgi:hypothetical protein
VDKIVQKVAEKKRLNFWNTSGSREKRGCDFGSFMP